jgi:NADPH2:quinone reductase
MKAIFTSAPGGYENTSIQDVPDPVAGAGEVVVDIRAVGLNPADYFQIQGQYPGQPKAPFITGRDAAGVIAQGSGTPEWPAGTPVLVIQSQLRNLAEGTLCEQQRFPVQVLARIPEGWSVEEAAAAPLPYMTAWRALKICADCNEGSTVLVTGASGGVGVAAIQLALGLGANVIALSRSAEKRAKLLELGAQHAFDPEDADLKKKVPQAAGKHGVDIVVETVGGPFIRTAVHLLAPYGTVGVVGVLAGVEGPLPIPSLMFKRAKVQGILVSDYPPAEAQGEWDRIVATLARRSFKPIMAGTFPFANYLGAIEALKASPLGKIVITIP